MIDPSLRYLGGSRTDQYEHWAHMPKRQVWRDGYWPSDRAMNVFISVMGNGFPVRSVIQEIWDQIELLISACPDNRIAIIAFLFLVGRPVRVFLKAIRRNFQRHPEYWAGI